MNEKAQLRRIAKLGIKALAAGSLANLMSAALAGMLIYIAFRFEWIYGVAAVVTVFHDTLITVGAFSLMNTGNSPVPSKNGLVTTIAWRIGDKTTYALEGSAFVAGSAVQWLRDQLHIIRKADEVEALAARVGQLGQRPGDWEARQACFANVSEEWVDQAEHMLHHDQPAEVARIVEAFIG